MTRRLLLVLALLTVSSLAMAAKPDARAAQVAQWVKQGLVLRVTPLEGTVLVQVSEKWVKLPLERQTDMVRTIGDFYFEGLAKADAGVETLRTTIIRNEGSPALGIADSESEGTVVYWEDWYSRLQRRKETGAPRSAATLPAPAARSGSDAPGKTGSCPIRPWSDSSR